MIISSNGKKLWAIDHGRCLLAPLTSWSDLDEYPLRSEDLILIPELYEALSLFWSKLKYFKIHWESLKDLEKEIPKMWCPKGKSDIIAIMKVLNYRAR